MGTSAADALSAQARRLRRMGAAALGGVALNTVFAVDQAAAFRAAQLRYVDPNCEIARQVFTPRGSRCDPVSDDLLSSARFYADTLTMVYIVAAGVFALAFFVSAWKLSAIRHEQTRRAARKSGVGAAT